MKKSSQSESQFQYVPAHEMNNKKVWGHFFDNLKGEVEKHMHTHSTGILTGVKKGVVSIYTQNGSWTLSAGSVAYLPPATLHSTTMSSGYSGWILSIPKSQQKYLPEAIGVLQVSNLLQEAVKKIAVLDPKVDHTEAQKNIVSVILDELHEAQEAPFLRIPMPIHSQLQKVAKAILKKPDNMETLDDLAKKAAMSRRSFIRHFADETGISFGEWRQKVKVQAALQLLAEGKSVNEIAFELGYNNVSAFIAMFRKHFGSSPKESQRGKT